MAKSSRLSAFLSSPITEGLIVGIAATQVLDWLSIALYRGESEAERVREDEARGNLHAYERAVDQVARAYAVPLQRKDLGVWGWRFHKAFGLAGGMGYALLRRRYPAIGRGWGLGFGAAFFLGVDEGLVPLMGWTPGPRAFAWKVHARGAATHLAYGVVAESAIRLLERSAGSPEARAA